MRGGEAIGLAALFPSRVRAARQCAGKEKPGRIESGRASLSRKGEVRLYRVAYCLGTDCFLAACFSALLVFFAVQLTGLSVFF